MLLPHCSTFVTRRRGKAPAQTHQIQAVQALELVQVLRDDQRVDVVEFLSAASQHA
jgi:hypothetical protein